MFFVVVCPSETIEPVVVSGCFDCLHYEEHVWPKESAKNSTLFSGFARNTSRSSKQTAEKPL